MTSRLHIAVVLAGALAGSPLASAAGLTDADLRYLKDAYGPTIGPEIVDRMSADEQAKLHDIIAAHQSKDRYDIAADYLFVTRTRQCQEWAMEHSGQICPPPADPAARPGQDVADQQCNACHMFGTSRAPSFRAMAALGRATEAKLADAISHGHRMSPITLTPEQIKALAVYIENMK
jgi:cytochrome c5